MGVIRWESIIPEKFYKTGIVFCLLILLSQRYKNGSDRLIIKTDCRKIILICFQPVKWIKTFKFN